MSGGKDVIDLEQFCTLEGWRLVLSRPFSAAAFTYAADGAIAVRVPRRADVSENPDAARYVEEMERRFAGAPVPAVWERRRFYLPPPPLQTGRCPDCHGDGALDCDSDCARCDGQGELSGEFSRSTSIDGIAFGLGYVRRMLSLPDVEIAMTACDDERHFWPLMFRFDGGEGLLMPLRSKRVKHVEIEVAR